MADEANDDEEKEENEDDGSGGPIGSELNRALLTWRTWYHATPKPSLVSASGISRRVPPTKLYSRPETRAKGQGASDKRQATRDHEKICVCVCVCVCVCDRRMAVNAVTHGSKQH